MHGNHHEENTDIEHHTAQTSKYILCQRVNHVRLRLQSYTLKGPLLAVLSLYWIPWKDREPMLNEDKRLGNGTKEGDAGLSGNKREDPHEWMLGTKTQSRE